LALDGELLWHRYYQDRYSEAHILDQGTVTVSRSFGAGAKPEADVTISTQKCSINKVN
jgi:hypothetical protein